MLLRRVLAELVVYDLQIGSPIRCSRQKLVKPAELERVVELALLKSQAEGPVLILIDADDDCPAQLGPALLERARRVRPGVPMGVVLAKHEFEAWFLGAWESLRHDYGRPNVALLLHDSETIRGAKERLAQQMGSSYSEVIDQPSMAATFDMRMARDACPSFDKLWRTVQDLMARRRNL